MFTLWDPRRPITPAAALAEISAHRPDAYIAEAEISSWAGGATDWLALTEALEDEFPALPKAIATNFAPFVHEDGTPAPAKATPLIARGWRCLTEAYLPENPQANPDALDHRARQLGFHEIHEPASAPIFGVYGGFSLDDYAAWLEWPGWSAWSAEYLLASPLARAAARAARALGLGLRVQPRLR